MTGWQAVVAALAAEGVKRVYGLPGDPTHLYDALYDVPAIKPILVRHECSGVFMAMAEARVGHRVAVCHASPGPGMTNMLSGLLEAFSGCSPVVCITTGTPSTYLGMGAFQENDAISIARPVTKWAVRVERPERIPWTMRRAFSIAASGKPGPVLVEIPADVGLASIAVSDDEGVEQYRPGPGRLRTSPDPHLLEAAAALLRRAVRPVLVAGGGVIASEAGPALVALAEQEAMAIMTSATGRGALAEDHPLAFGLVGLYRTAPGRDAFNDADVLVTIGCRMEAFQSGNWALFPNDARMVQIDVDPFELGRNFLPDAPVLADARLCLRDLAAALATDPGRRSERQEHMAKAVAAKDEFVRAVALECARANGSPLQSKRIVHELNDVYGHDTILVNENGGQDLWTYYWPYYRVLDADAVVPMAEQTCMGAGVTGAVGAKLTRPDKKVVCVAGDGAFQMMPQELSTAVQYGAPVTWIVLNTRSLGWSKWHQVATGRFIATDFEAQPDFVGLARAHGCHGEHVENPEEIRPALERARELTESGTPVVVEFEVEPFDYYDGFKAFPSRSWGD